ncbi:Phage portal protein, SPP1 Gp6 [Corynebacterium mustelae]|uniref:Phage portal protein, SPP1 Gp6 n=1 Tax=Corynebacterium mustelae TaxID=571915 RepID=A0A0G3GTT7_9CORY|nr:phage portal protein [Corynebacterium mustelae]AKK04586.1 Phage portal protein, SPP1 Gp6 [Corynebacterium mustelae]
MNRDQATEAVRELLSQHATESIRHERINSALQPWSRRQAAKMFGISRRDKNYHRHVDLAIDSQAPFLPLVLDTFGQAMKVENYLAGNSGDEQSPAWRHWQRNSMDAVQSGINRAALQYGVSYAIVTGKDARDERISPIISGKSPMSITAFYGESLAWPGESGANSEWPIIAAYIKGNRIRLYDEENIYFFGAKNSPKSATSWKEQAWNSPSNLEFIEKRPHGVGVVPIVRFRDQWLLDGEYQAGMVEPLISLQKRIDRTSYEMGSTQYVAAFKQRYVIGWRPKDELTAARMKASDTWFINEDQSKVKVGQFDETNVEQYIKSRESTIRDLAAIAQVPAQSLGAGTISNVSADGLIAMERAKESKVSELQTALGESYEQLLRLCAHIAGDEAAANDFAAEVKWKDTSAKNITQVVDALGKLATMLNVPAEALLEDIPGFTYERIQRIKRLGTSTPDATGGMF